MRKTEKNYSKPWASPSPPKKILIIRFHAFGDMVIALPYLQALKNVLPHAEFHFLTRGECADLLQNVAMMNNIVSVSDNRKSTVLLAKMLSLLSSLRQQKYDVVIDLQRNEISRFVRRVLSPKAFCEFDRYSIHTAGERTKRTIQALELPRWKDDFPSIVLKQNDLGMKHLFDAGYDPQKKLVVINPAGSSVTKNWNLENYVTFANGLNRTLQNTVQYLFLGTERIQEKARYFQNHFHGQVVNLVGRTTTSDAFCILKKADFVLSEDSGLMHMAWVAHVPVLALLGSTPSYWSKPLGNFSLSLDSSDLECGNCNSPACKYSDVRCLSRHTPESVLEIAKKLLSVSPTKA